MSPGTNATRTPRQSSLLRHQLKSRRTVATHAQNLGSPKDIQTIMRHKKAETAQQHYIQVTDESVKATTEKLASKLLHS
jgi:integrase